MAGKKWVEKVSLPWGGERRLSIRTADRYLGSKDPKGGDYGELFGALIVQDYDPTAPWEVTVTWEGDSSSATPVEISLRSVTGGPVTAEAWRQVRVGAVIGETRERLQHLARARARRSGEASHAADVAAGLGPGRSPRRLGANDSRIRKAARVYDAALAEGRRDPLRAVNEAFGLPAGDVRPKGWVRTARVKGYLPPARRKDT